MEIDAIGEILNISLGASATAVSSMLDARVDITTPVVRVVKKEEFSKCSHIWIPVSKNVDYYEGRSDIDYGCMKCGLDQRVLSVSNPEFLSDDDKIMYNYLCQHYAIHQGIKSHTLCDLDLAHAMYSKIVEYHPEIDDVTALKYFEIALDNMRNIRVNDDRKESRVKRLMLKPGFHNWGGYKN